MYSFKLDMMTLLVLLVAAGFVATMLWGPGSAREQSRDAALAVQTVVDAPLVVKATTEDSLDPILPVSRVIAKTPPSAAF